MSKKQTFKVKSFRKVPNPYIKAEHGEKAPEMYVMICDVKDIPEGVPMDTNPREQNLNTGVAKKIKESLLDENNFDFYLLNRGILISAASIDYDNYSNEVTVEYSDIDFHGNVDGGHTYKIILENRDAVEHGKQFVRLEVITGVEGIFQALAAARNKSVPVKDEAIAELEAKFQIIKDAILAQPYKGLVNYKQNGEGEIEIMELLSILNMFNIDRFPSKETSPTMSYSSNKKCLENYLADYAKHGNTASNPYVKMQSIIPDIFKLYDHLEINIQKYYREKISSGKYGAVKGVAMSTDRKTFKSKFFQKKIEYYSPNGFLYPIIGAFRSLVCERNGKYEWRSDPFVTMNQVGKELVDTTVERSRSLGNNPQSTGKDTGNWQTLYMLVRLQMLDV